MIEWLPWIKWILTLKWVPEFFASKKIREQQSDIETFKRLDAIANESQIDEILNEAIYTSHFYLNQKRILIDLIDNFSRIQNIYLDSNIKNAAEDFCKELKALLNIVSATYWKVPGGWLKFRPDPIDSEVYDAEWKEVNEKIGRTWLAYRNYRIKIKQNLLL